MWKKCLSKCCELLEASVATLSEVSDTSILEEIARSEEARNKLRGTSIACRQWLEKRAHTKNIYNCSRMKYDERHLIKIRIAICSVNFDLNASYKCT